MSNAIRKSFGQLQAALPQGQQSFGYESGGHTMSDTGNPVKGLRFVSGFIDLFVMAVMCFIIMMYLGASMPSDITEAETAKLVWRTLFLLLVPGMLYGIVMEASSYQGTFGKIATGTVVTDKEGNRISLLRSVGRNFGKILSGIFPFYIPYFMVLFTKQNQSLHDIMAGTLVFKKGEGPVNEIGQVFA